MFILNRIVNVFKSFFFMEIMVYQEVNGRRVPGGGGEGGTKYGTLVCFYVQKKNNEKGRFLSQMGGVPGPPKGGYFHQKG